MLRRAVAGRLSHLQPIAWLANQVCYSVRVMELTPAQINILERLHSRGLEIVAFPMYESVVGVRKGNCAALLSPAGQGGFTIQGQPTYLIGGNLSARVVRTDGHYFVRKQEQLEATPERLAELEAFTAELSNALLPVA